MPWINKVFSFSFSFNQKIFYLPLHEGKESFHLPFMQLSFGDPTNVQLVRHFISASPPPFDVTQVTMPCRMGSKTGQKATITIMIEDLSLKMSFCFLFKRCILLMHQSIPLGLILPGNPGALSVPGAKRLCNPETTLREFYIPGFKTVESPGRQDACFIPYSRWKLLWEKIWISSNSSLSAKDQISLLRFLEVSFLILERFPGLYKSNYLSYIIYRKIHAVRGY